MIYIFIVQLLAVIQASILVPLKKQAFTTYFDAAVPATVVGAAASSTDVVSELFKFLAPIITGLVSAVLIPFLKEKLLKKKEPLIQDAYEPEPPEPPVMRDVQDSVKFFEGLKNGKGD